MAKKTQAGCLFDSGSESVAGRLRNKRFNLLPRPLSPCLKLAGGTDCCSGNPPSPGFQIRTHTGQNAPGFLPASLDPSNGLSPELTSPNCSDLRRCHRLLRRFSDHLTGLIDRPDRRFFSRFSCRLGLINRLRSV